MEYMAREQNLFELEAHYENDGDPLLKQKLSPISASTEVSDNESSGYDCNICLDSAHDPIVTLCGHLFCWACIYKWFHIQTSANEADKPQQNCPVCKANISLTSLVPLYGRGTSSSESESKKHNLGVVVPRRPPPSMLNTSVSSTTASTTHRTPQLHPDLFQLQTHSSLNPQYLTHQYGGYAALATSSLGGMATISFVNPLMGMFGGVVLERIFGSSVTSLSMYPTPHPVMTGSNRRIRRQEVEIDKSLNRVSIFLFCCLILCLLLF
ncbi:E3 ubiquitin-protein ligase RMA3-like isoform X2 [Mangifera indica]|uniref:E3 ubiquitin-protein ligase RMA3-like isoform X2 n=1 Tax=Mangifera indica TaxID=29780 RepID=UPI001CFA572C|nr:E3 ubiquitin-protein ligase RMA3-like isoform X2 [Mangifera indica]